LTGHRASQSAPLISVQPYDAPTWVFEAVREGGGEPSAIEEATGIIWYSHDAAELGRLLVRHPHVSWVQLRSAGIERYQSLLRDGRIWTNAKGIYGEAVAEHALALALSWLREIPQLARIRTWTDSTGGSLYDAHMTIVGAGGVARAILELVKPFRVTTTIVRRRSQPVENASRTLSQEALVDALIDADIVVLACALVEDTAGLFGARAFDAMAPHALLVNVGRGRLVRTNDLVGALTTGQIGGAALDVVDPEPLPADHPLWRFNNVLITPHSGNPDARGRAPLARLITENVRRFANGAPLLGQIDVELGY
jgi:phosphoglycerate dehydrogenase-like enzyme